MTNQIKVGDRVARKGTLETINGPLTGVVVADTNRAGGELTVRWDGDEIARYICKISQLEKLSS